MSEPKQSLDFISASFTLLKILLGEDAASELFRTLNITRRTCVLDTNAILPLISHALRKQKPIPLLRASGLGGVTLLASTTVYNEVPEKIREKGWRDFHMDPDAAIALWRREFVPRIAFLNPTQIPTHSLRVARVVSNDPTDAPTGQLIELFHPHSVYSNDQKHLGHFDILGNDTSMTSAAYHVKAKRDAALIGIHLGGGVVLTLSIEAFAAIRSVLAHLDKRLLTAAVFAGTVGLAIVACWPATRRWVTEHLSGPLQVAAEVLIALNQIATEAKDAERDLIEMQRFDPTPKTALYFAARVLGAAPGPLSATEITSRMMDIGYYSRSQNPHHYVARVLRQCPDLVEEVPSLGWKIRTPVAAIETPATPASGT